MIMHEMNKKMQRNKSNDKSSF